MFRSLSPLLWKSPLNGPIRLPLTQIELNIMKFVICEIIKQCTYEIANIT